MPRARLQFAPAQESAFDQLAGAAPMAMNVVVDGKGTVRRRPGLATTSFAPATTVDASGLRGIHVAESGSAFVFGGSGKIWKVTGGSAAHVNADAPLLGGLRPVVTETEAILAVADGGNPVKFEFATGLSSPLANAPTCTHIAGLASRLLANDTTSTNICQFSDLAAGSSFAGHEVWGAGNGDAGFFAPEARPDALVAVYENAGSVFLFGKGSFQTFAPDGALYFAPLGTREVGCVAPYSPLKVEQGMAWLDQFRRFVISDGQDVQPISGPIHQDLLALSSIEDCFGFRYRDGRADLLVWSFPAEGRTFAYQLGGGWCQWSRWNASTLNWSALGVTGCAFARDLGDYLVTTGDGLVLSLSSAHATDEGSAINSHVITGYESHESDAVKRCIAIRLALRRGETTGTNEPHVLVKYRDQPGDWKDQILVSLGAPGDREAVVELRSLGTYRRRQWCFEFAGTEDLVLLSAEEEYDVR